MGSQPCKTIRPIRDAGVPPTPRIVPVPPFIFEGRPSVLGVGIRVEFPPNREIRDGEPLCELCGSGWSTHEDGRRSHIYQGRIPLTHRAWRFVKHIVFGDNA